MEEENSKIDIIYIKRVYGASCGPDPQRSKILYYRNTHPTYTIKITIDHWWIDDQQILRHEKQNYTLSPNPTHDYYSPNSLDIKMGCMIPGPTLQEFHWDLKDAIVVNNH